VCGNSVIKLQGRHANNQILEGNRYTSLPGFTVYSSGAACNLEREWIGRNRGKQVVEKLAPAICLSDVFRSPDAVAPVRSH